MYRLLLISKYGVKMDEYVGLNFKGIPESKLHVIESFANRHGAKVISKQLEGDYYSAEVSAKKPYEQEIIKGILGPGYAKEVSRSNDKPSKFDYLAIQGD